MSKITETIWIMEPHTKAKHEILKRYLGAWFAIMGSKNPRIIYLDGFCGPGRYKHGEDGSPLLALKLAIAHNKNNRVKDVAFIFVDKDQRRIEHLEEELATLLIPQNFHVSVIDNEFDNTLSKLFDDLEKRGTILSPTFAFLDPFGYSLTPYKLVERLLQNPKTEVFVNLAVDSINRFLNHPEEQQRQRFTDLFGTSEVLEIINSKTSRIPQLRLLYQIQLEKCAKYVRYFEMRDKNNRIVYYLFFATQHPLGLIKMKEAFWKVDSINGYQFSDKTDPNQPVLFGEDHTKTLAEIIEVKYYKKKIAVLEIKNFVELETPYLAKHMRDTLKQLEDQGRLCVDPCKQDGKKRKQKSFPEEAIVTFIN